MGADHACIFADLAAPDRVEQVSIGQTVAMRRCAAVLFVGVIALAACGSSGSKASSTTTGGSTGATTAANGEPEGTKTFTGLVRTHIDTPVDYPQKPPVGGPHSPVWQNCAFYGTPILSEHGVHSMEHGAVWITFDPKLASAQIGLIKKLVKGQVLASPFDGLPSPVVATAWGKQLQLQSADDPRLAQFVKYFANGPQTPEPGAVCSGGTSETAS
jgi:hypothetical protein